MEWNLTVRLFIQMTRIKVHIESKEISDTKLDELASINCSKFIEG